MLTSALQRRELKDLVQDNDYNPGKFGPGRLLVGRFDRHRSCFIKNYTTTKSDGCYRRLAGVAVDSTGALLPGVVVHLPKMPVWQISGGVINFLYQSHKPSTADDDLS